MKKLIFSFLVFTIFFLASCSSDEMPIDNNIVDGGDKMVVSLSSEEALSLVADKSYTLSDDEVLQVLDKFSSENDNVTRTSHIGTNNFRIINNYKIACKDDIITRTPTSRDSIEFSSISLGENEYSGLAIVCRDSRYPEVLAYVPNVNIQTVQSSKPAQMMIDRAQSVAMRYIEKCNTISKNLKEQTITKVCNVLGLSEADFDFDKYRSRIFIKDYDAQSRDSLTTPTGTELSTIGPLCGTTRLIQGWPCNQFIPETTLEKYNTDQHRGHYPAGCVNVALAVICSYLQPTIYSSDLGRNINWNNVCNTHFNPFGFYASEYSPSTDQAIEVGYLLKTLANGTKTTFSLNGGSTTTPNAASYMSSIGVSMSSSTSTLNYANVRTSLSNLALVYCTGTSTSTTRSDGGGNGHAWVIDGLQIRKPSTRMELQNYNCYANCKFGWIEWDYTSTSDGWYLFDTSGTITFDFDSETLSTNLACVPNIKLK